jgi:hypothetical protein
MNALITLLLSLAALLGTVAFYARESTAVVLANAAEQAIYLGAYLLPAGLLGRALLSLFRTRPDSRALLVSTCLALGVGTLGIIELLLGLGGLLSGPAMWCLLAGAAAAGLPFVLPALRAKAKHELRLGGVLSRPIPLPGLWPVVAIYLGVMVVGGSLIPGVLWKPDDPHPYDVLIYHLQVPREWYELGRIVPLEHNVYSYFPFNVEIHYLAMMHLRGGPWAAMYQAQYLSMAFSCAAALALWGTLRPLSRTGAALAVAAFLLVPWIAMLSCIAYVEAGQMFYVALALAWLFASLASRTNPAPSAALAGLFSGFSAGVKLTSLAMFTLPAGLLLLICFPLARPGERKPKLIALTLFGLCTLLALSPWLIRNQVWSGNPVFPVAMNQLGAHHFTPEQVTRFERAHSAGPDKAGLGPKLASASQQIWLDWRYGLVLLPMGIAGFALSIRRREAWLCLAVIVGTTLVWLFATHLQSRFFSIALPAIALLIGLWPDKAVRWAALLLVLSAIAGLTGLTLPGRATNSTGLHAYLAPWSEPNRQGVFALPSPSALDQEAKYTPLLEAGRTVLFVGDAQIFLRTAPMSHIRYRTVFDVDATAGRNLVDAWYGPAPAAKPPEIVPVISLSELDRLHATYYGIPAPKPEEIQQLRDAIVTP